MAITSLTIATAFAGGIREGATMHVKDGSMWFQQDYDLDVWQRFKAIATPEVMDSYQDVVLECRQAWQFVLVQTVKILTYWPDQHRVKVRMQGPPGKAMTGTLWWVDDRDIVD